MNRLVTIKQQGLRSLQLGVAILFRPSDGFDELRKNRSLTTAFVLIFLIVSVRVITIYMTSFHIATIQPEYADLVLEMSRFIFPLLSGVVVCYLITAIMDGEAHFSEILTAMSFAMIPYIVFTIPIALLSLLVSREEIGLYYSATVIVWLWVALLIFIQIKVLNDYSFKKSVGVVLLCIFAFITFWATVGLVFALTNHVLQFINEVIVEIRYLLEN